MISIIIVHYHVEKELFSCISSIYKSKPKTPFEVIIVDNDENKNISQKLQKKFPEVIYIPNENKGFGQGNNIGARIAQGKYLFFLNPDTIVYSNTIDLLIAYLNRHKDVGIVAPILYFNNKKIIPLQGLDILTPFRALLAFSFINKLFPRNRISRKYWNVEWDKKSVKKVGAVPGTAFVIRKNLFEKIGGFDEKFFLFFEETDLCKRVHEIGWKIIMYPNAHVYHIWGSSTQKSNKNIQHIFHQSRFYYFKKHFGFFTALLTEFILRINKNSIFLFCILIVAAFLNFHRLSEIMTFIGDQGWYYLSARDMLLTGNIPLVGIASSHIWLHQGAYWTYIVAICFWLFNYHPVSPAYFTAALGVLAVFYMYESGKTLFSTRIGLIAAALYATSPLIITSARMPYHTSPIPFFTILLMVTLNKWMSGNIYYFPMSVLILGILYNFELATFVLTGALIIILCYGLWRKQLWARAILGKKILILSFTAFILSMLPMLIYDMSYNYVQTFGFLRWVVYKTLVFLGFPSLNDSGMSNFFSMILFSAENYRKLIFTSNGIIAFFLFVCSFGYFLWRVKYFLKEKGIFIIAIINVTSLAGFLISKTPSDAYLHMLFPGIIFITALFIDSLFQNKFVKPFAFIGLFFVMLFNALYLLTHHYFYDSYLYKYSFPKRVSTAQTIIKQADGKAYNIRGEGPGSQFKSFTMNYEYLTWWMGNGPSKKTENLQFIISEDDRGIILKKRDYD